MSSVETVCLNLQNISWGPLILHYLWCEVLVLISAYLICHAFLLYRLGFRALFCSWVVWLKYYWNQSGRLPRYNYFLCLIALEIFQLGQNNCFQLSQIDGEVLHLCFPLTWWIKVLNLQQQLPMVVASVGPGDLWPWNLIMGDTLKWVSMRVLSMLQRIHHCLSGSGCAWLESRGSDGKKLLNIAGMLGDMIWGAMEPLV